LASIRFEELMAKSALFGGVVLALIAPLSVAAQQPPARDLTGTYACEGRNPDGSAYTGVVDIAKLEDTFLVRWMLPQQPPVVGVGLLSGDILSVSYFGGTPSIVVYTVASDGRLDGKWTAGGTLGAVFKETLSKTAARSNPTRPVEPRKPSRTLPGVRGRPAN
jgi:hypothetical protein